MKVAVCVLVLIVGAFAVTGLPPANYIQSQFLHLGTNTGVIANETDVLELQFNSTPNTWYEITLQAPDTGYPPSIHFILYIYNGRHDDITDSFYRDRTVFQSINDSLWFLLRSEKGTGEFTITIEETTEPEVAEYGTYSPDLREGDEYAWEYQDADPNAYGDYDAGDTLTLILNVDGDAIFFDFSYLQILNQTAFEIKHNNHRGDAPPNVVFLMVPVTVYLSDGSTSDIVYALKKIWFTERVWKEGSIVKVLARGVEAEYDLNTGLLFSISTKYYNLSLSTLLDKSSTLKKIPYAGIWTVLGAFIAIEKTRRRGRVDRT